MSKPEERTRSSSPEFLEVFRRAAGSADVLPFDAFMRIALYDPVVGYYRRARKRVGYGGADFFTASSTGTLFGELVAEACCTLLRGQDAGIYTFVEIGAEPDRGIMDGVAHPFAGVQTLRVGEPLNIEGRCIVFSNELFDAQPFRRFVFTQGAWQELGVGVRGGSLVEAPLPSSTLPAELPDSAPESYHLDLPLDSATLAETIARQPWQGLFVAFDYGKPWRDLVEAAPAGTARAYHQHTQSNDLLARPGEQDLTCHVCWDWLARSLQRHGFEEPALQTQEAFLIKYAGARMGRMIAEDASKLSQRKLGLLQLIHHLGQKFQVLTAVRTKS